MIHIPRKLSRRCGLVAATTALCVTLAASGLLAQSQSSDEPRYAPGGDLLLPNGFDTWVFVGSNLGLSYTPDAAAAACHQLHASIDNVWVQFYPALRDRRP
jgi:hypothetical protein